MVQFLKALAASAALALTATAAEADSGAVTIRYDMTIAGFPIGSANLNAVIRNDVYRIDVGAKIGGILSIVSDGRGSATATGRMGDLKPQAAGYALDSSSSKKMTTVRMSLAGGSIRDVTINPMPDPRPDRVPVTDADKRGVLDPVSALLMPVAGKGEMLASSSCNRILPVFDGAQRFDISLSYARMERVSVKGYNGNAVVCSARYTPIAGHRTKRDQTKFMAQNRDMEVWLVPVEGTRVLAPWRIAVGTQVGRLVIETSRFNTAEGTAPTVEAGAN